jgi:hypothetical protein
MVPDAHSLISPSACVGQIKALSTERFSMAACMVNSLEMAWGARY